MSDDWGKADDADLEDREEYDDSFGVINEDIDANDDNAAATTTDPEVDELERPFGVSVWAVAVF